MPSVRWGKITYRIHIQHAALYKVVYHSVPKDYAQQGCDSPEDATAH